MRIYVDVNHNRRTNTGLCENLRLHLTNVTLLESLIMYIMKLCTEINK
jgi:hypothetical protein